MGGQDWGPRKAGWMTWQHASQPTVVTCVLSQSVVSDVITPSVVADSFATP